MLLRIISIILDVFIDVIIKYLSADKSSLNFKL